MKSEKLMRESDLMKMAWLKIVTKIRLIKRLDFRKDYYGFGKPSFTEFKTEF